MTAPTDKSGDPIHTPEPVVRRPCEVGLIYAANEQRSGIDEVIRLTSVEVFLPLQNKIDATVGHSGQIRLVADSQIIWRPPTLPTTLPSMTDPTSSPELKTLPMIHDAVQRAQKVLAARGEPRGPSETDAINDLLGILDHYEFVGALNAIEPLASSPAADLLDEVRNRNIGRIARIHGLKEIVEQSISHADAVERARSQLSAAGAFYKDNPALGEDATLNPL